jgi:hypothetical protein
MKSAPFRSLVFSSAVLAIAGAVGLAQIERLDLSQMVAKADDGIVGTIRDREVIRIDHPVDGDELYFTHLTIEGSSLSSGKQATVVVTYAGGWIDEEHGADNSEAPALDEVEKGKEVVAFYKWTDNMGGDLAANALYASHGGIYQVAKGSKGKVVLGKGEGYAVSSNVALGTLNTRVAEIHAQLRKEGKK